MIINWLAEKVQQFSPAQDAGLDEHELSISFDFALNTEIMDVLYAKNTANKATTIRFALDEHELALA